MNIKLLRMVKHNDTFIPKNTIVNLNDSDAQGLINAKAAVPAFSSSVLAGSPVVVNKKIASVIESVVISTPKTDNAPNSSTGGIDESNIDIEEGLSIENEVDISNFKVVEEEPVNVRTGEYQIPGINHTVVDILVKNKYTTLNSLKGISVETLVALPKIGYSNAKKIVEYIKGI